MAANICGARNRQGGPCRRPAGWGTPHPGSGRCKLHGGRSTGPPRGTKNNLKTGEYESIFLGALDADERRLFGQVNATVAKLLDEEIRLTSIRERRMLDRIASLREAHMTVVEITEEHGADPDQGEEAAGRPVVKRKLAGTLGQIQSIEEALTRVQLHKARLLELKHRIESGGDPGGGDKLDDLLERMEAAAHAAVQPETG